LPRKVEVTVDRQGRLTVNFIGFRGTECEEEAAALRRALRAIGLIAGPVEVVYKSEEELLQETREPEIEPERVRREVGSA